MSDYSCSYDTTTDVLYITLKNEAAHHSIEDSEGIVWRFDEDSCGIGATVLDLHYWKFKKEILAETLSQCLGIDRDAISCDIETYMEYKGDWW